MTLMNTINKSQMHGTYVRALLYVEEKTVICKLTLKWNAKDFMMSFNFVNVMVGLKNDYHCSNTMACSRKRCRTREVSQMSNYFERE